ncbi:MAG: tetratricopeptide repeat protein [Bacteriovoracaceae bacterium]
MLDQEIERIRYSGGSFHLKDYAVVELSGSDASSFLHNFSTSNVEGLKEFEFNLSARLNIRAQVLFYFYILKRSKELFHLVIPKSFLKELSSEFEKFIIAEDVEYETKPLDVIVHISKALEENIFKGRFLEEEAGLELIDGAESQSYDDLEILNELSFFSGVCLNQENFQAELVNNTRLNEVAVDYQKGCFLGQETAAKIHVNRGAAKFPALLEIGGDFQKKEITLSGNKNITIEEIKTWKGKTLLKTTLSRDFLLDDLEVDIGDGVQAKVKRFPYFKDGRLTEKAQVVFEKAVAFFSQGEYEKALDHFKKAIEFDPTFADAYESLGVLYGRLEQYEKAIEQMDKLLKVDPDSVMAHTNKSLYFMKLGKIEEAEEEKSNATVKSFAQFGKEAKEKKEKEAQKEALERERETKKKMFHEVLEIDPDDEFANTSLGGIYLEEQEFDKAKTYLEKSYEIDPKNPQMLLSLCKLRKNEGDSSWVELKNLGIDIALKKGRQKIALELQKIL